MLSKISSMFSCCQPQVQGEAEIERQADLSQKKPSQNNQACSTSKTQSKRPVLTVTITKNNCELSNPEMGFFGDGMVEQINSPENRAESNKIEDIEDIKSPWLFEKEIQRRGAEKHKETSGQNQGLVQSLEIFSPLSPNGDQSSLQKQNVAKRNMGIQPKEVILNQSKKPKATLAAVDKSDHAINSDMGEIGSSAKEFLENSCIQLQSCEAGRVYSESNIICKKDELELEKRHMQERGGEGNMEEENNSHKSRKFGGLGEDEEGLMKSPLQKGAEVIRELNSSTLKSKGGKEMLRINMVCRVGHNKKSKFSQESNDSQIQNNFRLVSPLRRKHPTEAPNS